MEKKRGHTTVKALEDDARVAEITRMLSGMVDSTSGREHARELLATAELSKADRIAG